MRWYFLVLKKYADFTGRASRKEFWMFVLVNLLILFILSLLNLVFNQNGDASLATIIIAMWAAIFRKNDSATLFGLIIKLYSLAVFLPSLAVSVRRLHDTNRSGVNILFGFLPIIGTLILLFFYVQDPTPGKNQYGPAPKLLK